MKRGGAITALLLFNLGAVLWMTSAFAETYPVISNASALISANSARQNVSGSISWIAPSHTDSTPITGYQIRFFSNLTGANSTYEGLICDVDVSNARCSISGFLVLNQGSQFQCTSANVDFLNRIYSVRIQALSNGSPFGGAGESGLTICDPSRVSSVPSPNIAPTQKSISPSPVQTRTQQSVPPLPEPVPSSSLQPLPTQDASPQNTISEKSSGTTPTQSQFANDPTAPQKPDSSTSITEESANQIQSFISTLKNLGLDLDSETRKKAQAIVVINLSIAISTLSIGGRN